MNSTFLLICSLIALGIIADTVVKIIKAAKQPGGAKAQNSRMGDLETDVTDLDEEVTALRQRVEVLEKIVTDNKYQLDKDIKDLAG